MSTGIPYITEHWPVVRGCTPCSPACDNCWAAKNAHMRAKNPRVGHLFDGLTTESGRWNGTVRVSSCEEIYKPNRWRKPRVVGVAFGSDLFHAGVPRNLISSVFATMDVNPRHTFLILTKRPDRMREALRSRFGTGYAQVPPLSNVWLGVSAWDAASLRHAADVLRDTPAAVRWISLEPCLSDPRVTPEVLRDIDWLVFGCESGPGARHPVCEGCEGDLRVDEGHSDCPVCAWKDGGTPTGYAAWNWAREVKNDCQQSGTAFYLKQLPTPLGNGRANVYVHPPLDGREWREFPKTKERER